MKDRKICKSYRLKLLKIALRIELDRVARGKGLLFFGYRYRLVILL